ncbi:hypothetical protein Srubr_27090 [Streptomyces rubradiris]|uniref:Uncharacterized protein n=1 Tax=Streptomyces rubradiris TaxID=285531 RepID=A0ABQ3RAI4_STRRR|nr:hypothetical protein GCM10018792_79290 [Streptomyces rubradiris]GHI52848.1 hypothetical protein Srubr_26940 [Streptomyces rubradiris]GHI52863.1 hypothetical protein Srubr_27090 [Streptomyces rubradiris]
MHPARALAYLARQDAGPPPADAEERDGWREELKAGHDAYRAGRAFAVGVDRIDTIRRAIESGRYDARDCRDLKEALDAVVHGCMSYWRATPYGLVWIDNES